MKERGAKESGAQYSQETGRKGDMLMGEGRMYNLQDIMRRNGSNSRATLR